MEILRDSSLPAPEIFGGDICAGADPYVFNTNNEWHLLLQSDTRSGPKDHKGITGYTLRSAARIEELAKSIPLPLIAGSESEGLHEAWAGEIHFEKYLYVAFSDGRNETHRMHVYETTGDVRGPWREIGRINAPREDDRWAIDMTFADITHEGVTKRYACWSGWENLDTSGDVSPSQPIVPQYIYIAEFLSPMEIGPRHKIASPVGTWAHSVAPILEGPQSLMLDGVFRGFVVTGNASWTPQYATNVLRYTGGNPVEENSWSFCASPLFPDGHGIGHGMIVEDESVPYYVGHRKTLAKHGWEDRVVFWTRLERASLEAYLTGSPYAHTPLAPIVPTMTETLRS